MGKIMMLGASVELSQLVQLQHSNGSKAIQCVQFIMDNSPQTIKIH